MISLYKMRDNGVRKEESLPGGINLLLLFSHHQSKANRTYHNDRLLLIERSLLPPSGSYFQSFNVFHFNSEVLASQERILAQGAHHFTFLF